MVSCAGKLYKKEVADAPSAIDQTVAKTGGR
jgi:hypothetical protein